MFEIQFTTTIQSLQVQGRWDKDNNWIEDQAAIAFGDDPDTNLAYGTLTVPLHGALDLRLGDEIEVTITRTTED